MKKIVEKISLYFFKFVYFLVFFAKKRVYKDVRSYKSLIINNIGLKIRFLVKDAGVVGNDRNLDDVIKTVVTILLCPSLISDGINKKHDIYSLSEKQYERYIGLYKKNIVEVSKLKDEIQESGYADKALSVVRYLSWLYRDDLHRKYKIKEAFKNTLSSYQDEERLKVFKAELIKYLPNVFINISSHNISAFYGKIGPYIKDIKKENRRLKSIISDRTAFKVNFSIEFFLRAVSFVTPFFLIGGYYYNKLFLGYYGIDISRYLSVGDYLSTSVDTVSYSIYGGLFSVVFTYVAFYVKSKIFVLAKRRRVFVVSVIKFLFVVLISSFLIYFLRIYLGLNLSSFSVSVFLFIILVVIFFASDISSKFAKEPLQASFIIQFIAVYVLLLVYNVDMRINYQEYVMQNKLYSKDFIFKDVSLQKNMLYYLSSSDMYFFFLDDRKKVFVIPREKIDSFVCVNVGDEIGLCPLRVLFGIRKTINK